MRRDNLLSGELRILGRITDASNATLLAEIESEKVVYKPIAGERPLWDFPSGNLASREYAAYLVSEELGFNIVPPTVLRVGPYGPGMVQLWCEPDQEIDVVQFSQSDNSLIRAMTLFDVVINNGDRKFGHILPISMVFVSAPETSLLQAEHHVLSAGRHSTLKGTSALELMDIVVDAAR